MTQKLLTYVPGLSHMTTVSFHNQTTMFSKAFDCTYLFNNIIIKKRDSGEIGVDLIGDQHTTAELVNVNMIFIHYLFYLLVNLIDVHWQY